MRQISSTTRFNAGMKSSLSSEWETPQWLYDELDRRFHFTFDAAASHANHKNPLYYTEAENALEMPWFGQVWCNPPYGRAIGSFVAKAVEEYNNHNAYLVVMLLPARTDARWFQKYVFMADRNGCGVDWLLFLKGRLKFELNGIPMKNSAPFPSVIALWGNAWSYSLEGFEHLGRVVRLNG